MTSKLRLARTVDALPPSGIRRFFDLVAARPEVISLGVGEPDFVTPWSIREAGIWSLEKGATSYTGNRGTPRTLNAISSYLQQRFGIEYEREELLVTVGASQAIDLALRAIVDPGDEVIIVEPCYVSYDALVRLAGGTPVAVPVRIENEYCPDPREIAEAVTPRTKAILLNYPNNPTGATYSRGLVEEIAGIVRRHDLLVISDEIYAELTFDGEHVCFATLEGMRERTLLVSGFSKAFAMTGWRLGYVAAPADLTRGMLKIHQYAMLCAPITAQYAAIDALGRLDTDVVRMRDSYRQRRMMLSTALNQAGLPTPVPKGAFYCFPDVRATGLDDVTFCERLLEEQEVAMVPGSAFGRAGEGFVRASLATSEEKLTEAGRRIQAFTRTLAAVDTVSRQAAT